MAPEMNQCQSHFPRIDLPGSFFDRSLHYAIVTLWKFWTLKLGVSFLIRDINMLTGDKKIITVQEL